MSFTAILGHASPASADDQLPFQGRANETVIGFDITPDGVLVTAIGEGQATYLGQFTRLATVLVHFDGTVEGTVVFTAANQDQLFADIEGVPTSLTTTTGSYTFTGGTGRFVHASGEAVFEAATSDRIHVTITFEGAIQY
jgi:hypothetical protein